MSGFDERERTEEAKFRHQQELAFKIRNRRNKLFGLWVAEEHLGLKGEEALAYAKDVVMADFDLPGDEDLFSKVKADLAKAGKSLSDHLLKKHLDECEEIAKQQIMQE
ncbi:MAG: DUF1476 domain-containing protein [Geminicoccaceae bacterium]|nr:DUF1476 domain-containing protein [Geminicoccaceae bacterium]MCS7266579.1 DUF1476 domain-containing protein [Geminicoccaceae bacterium]MCX7631140.1 DUF1476 domain-containing protein [Geminicoccaceae bacterium]MDW8123212.1 DUF1476 domain-containing protein [Geminicoccaceae bacterium]MDW8340128.1 DUF1476 domain-containing protein [Geminicoccaceae bacterium]